MQTHLLVNIINYLVVMARVEIPSRIVENVVGETQSCPGLPSQLKTRHYQQKLIGTIELSLHVVKLKPMNALSIITTGFKILMLIAIVQSS